jgi:hypothetical protein
VHRQQIALIKAHQDQVEEELRPAILLKPQLFVMNGKWWCVHGDHVEGRLAGAGDTPHAALRDFELNFYQQKANPQNEMDQ